MSFKKWLLAGAVVPALLAGVGVAFAQPAPCNTPACQAARAKAQPPKPVAAQAPRPAAPAAQVRPVAPAAQARPAVAPAARVPAQPNLQAQQAAQQKALQAQQAAQARAQAQQAAQQAAQQRAQQAQQQKLQQQQLLQQQRQQAQQQKLQQQQLINNQRQQSLQQQQLINNQRQQSIQQRQLINQQRQQSVQQQRQLQLQQQQLLQQQRVINQQRQFGGQAVRQGGGGIGTAGAIAIGVGAGVVGAALLSNQIRGGVTEVRTYRDTYVDGGVTYVREPGRVIVREPGGAFIRSDVNERFAVLGYQTRREADGALVRTIYDRPDGVRVITVTDVNGRLIRRIRRYPDGREVIIIDNAFRPPPARFVEQVVVLPPPRLTIPRERYIVDAGVADQSTIYEALTAPPLARPARRYTLDEVRYSPDLRAQMRSVDVNTITFESGSWIVDPGQVSRLATIAAAIDKAVQANPNEVFLIEGHTDAVGDTEDNLSLSDRRAQSVAEILTKDFNIPAENLETQGYGETQLRAQTGDAARVNRRVTVRRITPLIAEEADASSADAQAPIEQQAPASAQ